MGKSNLEKEEFKHPSYAVINIGRASIGGGAKRLFDSPFSHYHIVTLEINDASMVRSLHGNTVMPGGGPPYIRVAMSEIQFANLVLNANHHSGTPCTIEYVNGKPVDDPPDEGMRKLWAKDVKNDFKDIADAVTKAEKDVDALVKKDRVTKGDVRVIQETIRTLAQDIRQNIPWMQGRFQEAMSKTVADARGEIDAHFADLVRKTGLAALKGQKLPFLLGMDDPSAPDEEKKP